MPVPRCLARVGRPRADDAPAGHERRRARHDPEHVGVAFVEFGLPHPGALRGDLVIGADGDGATLANKAVISEAAK